jgi:hypothetical protein
MEEGAVVYVTHNEIISGVSFWQPPPSRSRSKAIRRFDIFDCVRDLFSGVRSLAAVPDAIRRNAHAANLRLFQVRRASFPDKFPHPDRKN